MSWLAQVDVMKCCMERLEIWGPSCAPLEVEPGYSELFDMTSDLKRRKGTVFLVGNGASASMASHVAADLAKNAHIRTEVFSDLSLITAIANDISYDEVFSEPLRRRMAEGDMLVAVSSSGNSPNVLRAVEECRELGGSSVTLSAMSSDNKLREVGDLNLYIPARTYGLAESCHAAILHYWIDAMVHLNGG